MNKKVKEVLHDIMADTQNISQKKVIDLLKTYDDRPNEKELIEKEYKARASRLMASFKDKKNLREVYTIKNNKDASEYINISRSREVDDLTKVRNRLEKNMNGNARSLRKVETRLYFVKNQVTLEDIAK